MAKFKKDGKRETPAISTASLPDIVFMLLFFFMVSTTMREVSLMVENGMPEATQTIKLEKKALVSNIYVGKPKDQYQGAYGTEPRIQLNDRFATIAELQAFFAPNSENNVKSQALQNQNPPQYSQVSALVHRKISTQNPLQ